MIKKSINVFFILIAVLILGVLVFLQTNIKDYAKTSADNDTLFPRAEDLAIRRVRIREYRDNW